MKDSLKQVFNDAVEFIQDNFVCEPLIIHVESPAEEALSTWRFLKSYTLNLNKDFSELLTQAAVVSIADTFDIDNHLEPEKYLAMLFQHFVHDGKHLPHSIDKVVIERSGKEIKSENITKQYKKQSQLYCQPTSTFQKKYDNWDISGTVQSNRIHIKATKEDILLGEVLKQQYLAPLLRHLIKLRIIHLCVSYRDHEKLKENNFFNVSNLEDILEGLQNNIGLQIGDILKLSASERKKLAKNENNENAFSLSPLLNKLGQHIPFVKLINGHTSYDIHQLNDEKASFFTKAKFYVKSHTNIILSQYILNRSYKSASKSATSLQQFITGQEKAQTLMGGFFNLMKSIYLLMWLPFFAAYFVVTGLTSLPFSLLRKALGVSFGGKIDKAITVLEAIKDSVIIYFGAPYAYALFTTVGAFLLGPAGLSIGATAAFYTSAVAFSPFLLLMLPEHYYFKPGWHSHKGVKTYRTESDNTRILNGLKFISSNFLVAIHAFVAISALVIFSGIAVTGYGLYKVKEYFTSKKCTKDDLMLHGQNLNHSQKFRQFLGSLRSKLAEASCNADEAQLLTALKQAQLTPEKKAALQDYIKTKIDNPATTNKSTYTLARNQINKNGAYLPSWKLVASLHQEIEQTPEKNEILAELQPEITRLNEIYNGPLAAYR